MVRDGQPNQLRRASGAVVDIPITMAMLTWTIRENLTLAKAHLDSGGLQQVNCLNLFKQGEVPLPEFLKLVTVAEPLDSPLSGSPLPHTPQPPVAGSFGSPPSSASRSAASGGLATPVAPAAVLPKPAAAALAGEAAMGVVVDEEAEDDAPPPGTGAPVM